MFWEPVCTKFHTLSSYTTEKNGAFYIYWVSPEKYTSLKSYIFVLRTVKSLNCVLLVRQNLNLKFETKFFKIGQKLTDLELQATE